MQAVYLSLGILGSRENVELHERWLELVSMMPSKTEGGKKDTLWGSISLKLKDKSKTNNGIRDQSSSSDRERL